MYNDFDVLMDSFTEAVVIGFGWALLVGFVSIAIVAIIHGFKSIAG